MQIEPNGLLAGDPLTPLASGHPFFRGNVMQGNGIDGLAVVTNRSTSSTPNYNTLRRARSRRSRPSAATSTRPSTRSGTATDLTYVLRGTLDPRRRIQLQFQRRMAVASPVPDTRALPTAPVPSPVVSLTIQAALPGTVLADGETIPSPGQSVIVKLFNDKTPNDAGTGTLARRSTGSAGIRASENAGAGFVVGVDDGVDPPGPSPLVDPGAYSELRILGIPGNQTTGQQRVPVIITSLRDDTVGTTVRGVQMYNIWNSCADPEHSSGRHDRLQTLHTPAAGDGGYIYIGGNSLTEYDPTDPLDGSIINNADISYMTRIEVQGGGIINSIKLTGTPGRPRSTDDWYDQLTGYLGTGQPAQLGDDVHDRRLEPRRLLRRRGVRPSRRRSTRSTPTTPGITTRPPRRSRPAAAWSASPSTCTCTTTRSPTPARACTSTRRKGPTSTGETPFESRADRTTRSTTTRSPSRRSRRQFNGTNELANVERAGDERHLRRLDRRSPSTFRPPGVTRAGQAGESQLQYNLFFNNATNLIIDTNDGDFDGNVGAIFGDPQFVGPVGTGDAGARTSSSRSTSPAIDAARSEIGPLPARQRDLSRPPPLSAGRRRRHAIRTDPATLPPSETARPRRILRRRSAFVDRSAPDRHPAGLGLLQLPRRVAAGPDHRSQRLLEPRTRVTGTYNYAPITGPARHPGLHPRPAGRHVPASASAATRSSTSVPTSTSTCIRPRSPA